MEGLKTFLDEKADLYNRPGFIPSDPIQIPHRYSDQADMEIAGFLSATLAWGRRSSIIASAGRLMALMPGGPSVFLDQAGEADFQVFLPFVHRTFNGIDCICFLKALQRIYRDCGGLERVFSDGYRKHGNLEGAVMDFRRIFFAEGDPGRTSKHLANLETGSAGKRLFMFLRWMVRRDDRGVDFGLWRDIPMSALHIPLDVHTGTVARKLGLLKRKQNDFKAVQELTAVLREMDPDDPVRYDFALFGLGSFEGF